jgi:hypothetical protein
MNDVVEIGSLENGGSASGTPVRLQQIVPVACAVAYPFLLQLLSRLLVAHGSALPEGAPLWFGVAGSLLLALGVMAAAFSLDRAEADVSSRAAAHLAFATPSLFVGFGNAANLMHSPELAMIAWVVFWADIAIVVLAPRKARMPVVHAEAGRYRRLGAAHGISASLILVLFVAPHLVNHMTGLVSGAVHIEFMKEARQLYRSAVFEPLLLSLVAFQVASGALLVRRRLRNASDVVGRLQTMTGVYIGIYFVAHLIAVFGARFAGTDTNWNWLTNNDHSMLATLSNLRLIGHYWFGPIAIATHLGCGLRLVLRQHDALAALADFAPRVVMVTGMVVSSLILAALLGVRV